MRQRLRDITFLILGVSLTILCLIKVISTIRHFKTINKYAKMNP